MYVRIEEDARTALGGSFRGGPVAILAPLDFHIAFLFVIVLPCGHGNRDGEDNHEQKIGDDVKYSKYVGDDG